MSNISAIIKEHGLAPGDTMKNIHGEDIEGSAVLNDRLVVIKRDEGDAYPGYDLLAENPLSGEETKLYLSAATFATLQSVKL